MSLKQILLIDPKSLSEEQYYFFFKLNGEKSYPFIFSRKEIQDCLAITLELNDESIEVMDCTGSSWVSEDEENIEFMQSLLKQEFEFVASIEKDYDTIVDYYIAQNLRRPI
jgi:hypothetical protein